MSQLRVQTPHARRNAALVPSRVSGPTPLGPYVGGRSLFDLLVRAQQNRWRYGKTERLGGLEVQDHLVFHRELHREIARLRAAQNAIHIGGGTTNGVRQVVSVGEQTAVSGELR